MARLPTLLVGRRDLLKASLITPLLLTGPAVRAAARSSKLVVFDNREPVSRQFASEQVGAKLDLAGQEEEQWARLRNVADFSHACGVSRWSDLLIVRAVMHDRHKRLIHEQQLFPHVFAWVFA